VNNVLCFPYIFRGALDAGATAITRSMEIAAVHAIATLARETSPLASASQFTPRAFGPEYLIPTPFDPRLIVKIAPAVARAAIADGVATRPIDLDDYTRSLVRWSQQGSANPAPLELQARSV